MFIYLARPRPHGENWEGALIKNLRGLGHSVFDPWAAWCGGADPRPAVAVVNLAAVAACDVTLAYCPDDIAATGTAIEIGYALAKEKKILIWQGNESAMFHHPDFHHVASIGDIERVLERLVADGPVQFPSP